MASLVGKCVPDIALQATSGKLVSLSQISGTVVLVVYPYTGVPGIPDPPGWDDIPGAHGSTPQCVAFSNRYEDFKKLDVKIFGLSMQTQQWQLEFVNRTQMAFPLLSDADGTFSDMLGLERFQAGRTDFLKRRTFVILDGAITHDVFPVLQPAENADEMLQILAS